MKVVSENTEADLARGRAERSIEAALRALTANLIRVTRGAGKPEEINHQIVRLAEATTAYSSAAGVLPAGDTLAGFIRLEDRDMSRWSDEERARSWAERLVVDGALQLTASRLLGQLTQERAGHSEMYRGLKELEEIRAEIRRKWAAEERTLKAARRAKPVRRKPTTKRPKG
jgi:hypothetical protein